MAVERQFTSKHHIQNDAEGPHIALLTIIIGDHFWSHKVWRARQILLSLFKLASQAKVDEFYDAVRLVEHNILRFNVPVNQALRMNMYKRTH